MIIIFLNSMMMILAHIEFKIPFDLAYEIMFLACKNHTFLLIRQFLTNQDF